MRTIQIHPLSLAVGAIAVSAAFVLTAQTTPPAQTTWPPPKATIVNVFERSGGSSFPVPAGGVFTVLTVPGDRWLTVTATSGQTPSGGPQLMWAELSPSGVLTNKGFFVTALIQGPEVTPISSGGPVGWTFSPGSSVVISNQSLTTVGGALGYALIGYYSRN